jgi:hypothetical protein
MSTTITIRDESISGKALNEWSLELLTERVTVRELIRSRVYQEVQDYNRHTGTEFRGLVQPTESERTLNGFRFSKPRQIDWKEQFNRATEAFEHGQILILVNERQVETLDEEVEIAPNSLVSFMRLTMLVGG